jgi:TetR/AcrR family transcriptional regulator, cholesterol catabolism regulator
MKDNRKQSRLTDATQGKIKRAAIKLFAIHGYEATTIRQIARAASIEGGSVYYHYSSKQDLLESIFSDGNKILLEAATEALSIARSNPKEILRQLVHAHLRVMENDPAQFVVVTRELQRLTGKMKKRVMNQRNEYELHFRQNLESGITQGYYRTCDIKLVSFGIIGLLNSVVYWYNAKGSASISNIADEYTELVLQGITADKSDGEGAT